MRLLLDPVWNWPVVAVAALGLLTLVLLAAPAGVRHLPRRDRRLLVGLRLLAALVLIFAMFRPALELVETDKRRAEFSALLDISRSMNTPDAAGGYTRRAALLKALESGQAAWQELAKEADLRMFDFDTHYVPVETPGPTADGQYTGLGKVLDDFRQQERSENLIGLLLATDGAQRAMGEDDVNLLAAARRWAELRGVPIYVMPLGTSELSTGGIDLAVEDLTLDQSVTFERKTVPVRAQVRLLGAAGKPVRVRLLVEDRLGKRPGETGELKPVSASAETRPFTEIRTNENSALVNVELSFIAEYAGEYKIALEVVPDPDETRLTNNRRETLISVRRGGLKVAYFDIARPEMRFLKRLNETAKIQLDTRVVSRGETITDAQLFALRAYDVYLIGDVPADAFGTGSSSLLNPLLDRIREGAGLAMLGGQHNYGAGGYASSPLAQVLPVQMSPNERIRPEESAPAQHLNRPLKMLPTRDGVLRYPMRLSAADNQGAWEALPEMDGANKLTPRSAAVGVFAQTAAAEPLFLASDTGRSRVAALAVDQTWKWHLHGHQAEHQRFWQQLVLWLARKDQDTDQPVWVRVEPRHFSPQANVPVEMGAQDETGQPLEDVEFQAEVLKPGGKVDPLTPRRQGTSALADYNRNDAPGDYWIRVAAQRNGKALGEPVMTRFVVDARDLELDNPAADPDALAEVAALTGGSVVPPEQFSEFLKQLLKEGIPEDLKRYRRVNLWDGWPLLLLFTALLSGEWTLRKVRGMP